MRVPHVNPVGLVEHPTGYTGTPRVHSAGARLAAAVLLALFAAVGVASTVYSLGAYCLTSHAGTPFPFAP